MLAVPDPNTFEIVPWRGEDAPVARMFCDIKHLVGGAVRRRPTLRAEAQPRPRPREGLHLLRRARDGVLHLRVGRRARRRSTHAGFFDLTQLDMVSDLRRQTIVTLEAMGIPVEYSFHELGPSQHEIDLRYTDALDHGRQRHDVPGRGEAGRHRPRRVRDVHAEADRGRVRFGDAHAPVAVRGRRQRVPRPGRRVRTLEGRASTSSPGCSRHAREITAITNQTVNSYKRLIAGLRGAGVRVLGPQQRVGARAGAGTEAGQGELDPHRVPLARPRVQPVPRVLGDARGRAARASRRATSSRPRPPTTSTR